MARTARQRPPKKRVNFGPVRRYAASTYDICTETPNSGLFGPEARAFQDRFLKRRPVHGQIRQSHPPLEMRAVIQIVLRRALGDFQRTNRATFPPPAVRAFHRTARAHRSNSAANRRARAPLNVFHEVLVEHAPLLMPLLPPRIGKVNVHCRHRCLRQQVRENRLRVAMHHHARLLNSLRANRAAANRSVFRRDFNSQKVVRRDSPPQPIARTTLCRCRLRFPSGAARSNNASASQGRGNWSGNFRYRLKSSAGSIFRSARPVPS